MIDESKARGLQSMFSAGASGALQPLYEECTGIAYMVALGKVRKMNGNAPALTHEALKVIAHGAATRLIERYLSDSTFHVRGFTKYLGYTVDQEMLIPARQRQRTFEQAVSFQEDIEFFTTLDDLVPAGQDGTLYDLAMSHPKGRKVAADLCRSRSYRQAVRRIAAYVERKWIYANADSLHSVYRALHRRTHSHDGVSGSGLVAVRNRILQGKRDQQKQADKRSGENAEG